MASNSVLLPYIDAIAEFLISSHFVWIWCSLTVLYAFRWLVNLQWESLRIQSQLKSAVQLLTSYQDAHELAKNFRDLHGRMMSLDKLRHPWREFCQTLIFPPRAMLTGEESESKDEKKKLVLKAPRDADEIFHARSIIQPSLNLRLFVAIPSQLTGLGMLGTLCGLASGIYLARNGLSGGPMEEIQRALAQLLGGAALGFSTSIAGILSSLIFTRIERFTIKNLQDHIDRLNLAIHSRIEPTSMEKLASLHVQQNNAHGQQLERIAASLELIRRERLASSEQLVGQMLKDFRATLIESTGREIEFIGTAFKQIQGALKETGEAIQITNRTLTQTTEAATKSFKKNLHELSHQFHSNFHQTTETIHATFKDVAREVTHSMNQGATNFGDTLKRPVDALSESVRKLNQQISQTNEALAQTTGRNIEHVSKILEAQKRMSEFMDPLLKAASAITMACRNSQGALEESSTAAKQIAGAVGQMEGIASKLQGSWEEYCQRFEGVDHSLHQVVSQTNQSIQRYSERMRDFTVDLDKHMSKGLLSLAGAVGDLHHVVGHLPEALRGSSKAVAVAASDKGFRDDTF